MQHPGDATPPSGRGPRTLGTLLVGAGRRAPLRRTEGGLTLLAVVALAAVPFVLALRTAGEVAEDVAARDGISALDQPMLEWMTGHRVDAATVVAQTLSTVGDVLGSVLLALVAIAVLCRWRRSLMPLLVIAGGMGGSVLATVLGKQAVGRLRPPVEFMVPPAPLSPSFPSGHSLNALVLGGLVAYLVVVTARRTWVTWTAPFVALAYALAVGWSRVYLGHHWLTDVLTGWALGLAWLAVVIVAHQAARAWRRRRARYDAAGAPPARRRPREA